jgi:hypothetical protein
MVYLYRRSSEDTPLPLLSCVETINSIVVIVAESVLAATLPMDTADFIVAMHKSISASRSRRAEQPPSMSEV